jgi:hypothetical protein
MTTQRFEWMWVALAFLVPLFCCPAWAQEPSFEVTGTYDAVADAVTARLALNDDGSAQYTVRWLQDPDSSILGKLVVQGRWVRQGQVLAFTFPNQGGAGKVVYEVSSCLAHKSFGGASCSPGLHVVTSDLAPSRTWELWKTELLVRGPAQKIESVLAQNLAGNILWTRRTDRFTLQVLTDFRAVPVAKNAVPKHGFAVGREIPAIEVWLLRKEGAAIPAIQRWQSPVAGIRVSDSRQTRAEVLYAYPLSEGAEAVAAVICTDGDCIVRKIVPFAP